MMLCLFGRIGPNVDIRDEYEKYRDSRSNVETERGGAFTTNDYWYVQSNHVVFDDLQ